MNASLLAPHPVRHYNHLEGYVIMNQASKKKLLRSLRQELIRIIGDDLEKILLYGSQARGDDRLDSDLNVLVIVRSEVDYARLIRQTSEVIAGLSLENDIVISRAFISKERFENEHSPFVLNVRREGIAV
jgi:predicted nucleotidyltransferase